MDESQVERTLAASEQALAGPGAPDLRALGFWRAVAAVKRDPGLVDRYAARIAAIDRQAFRRRVRLVFPVTIGIVVLDVGLFGGLLLLAIAIGASSPWREILVLAGAGALDVATHGLAHLAVGTLAGIGFTDWFVSLPKPPGFKLDYASYLRAAPRARAWMHGAGAIATKLTPFLIIPFAVAIGTETWALLVLLALGVVQILTDVLYSVRASDWKKFRREMRLAR
ncbi:MAG: hypothetical protein WEE03_08350 [Chloroflexota bacterium]